MKPIHFLPFLSLLLLLSPSIGNAAGSMLRISCDGNDVGAEVLVNGEFRGECPIDLQVPKGSLKLLVRKKVAGGRERVFEQEIRMGEGSVKKVEAHLETAKLNADEKARLRENTRRLKVMPLDALQKEATAGNAEAMNKLADYYKEGVKGAPKNSELANKWYMKSAEAGNVDAMMSLWAILADGELVPQDLTQSANWLRKAAETDSVMAITLLAEAYAEGNTGFPKDDAEALRWYRRAAEQGDTSSMLMIGLAYYVGKRVPENFVEAVAWFHKATDTGNQDAMYWLGKCYEKGRGVTVSENQAIYWWRKAAEGDGPNSRAVEELKRRGLR